MLYPADLKTARLVDRVHMHCLPIKNAILLIRKSNWNTVANSFCEPLSKCDQPIIYLIILLSVMTDALPAATL